MKHHVCLLIIFPLWVIVRRQSNLDRWMPELRDTSVHQVLIFSLVIVIHLSSPG